MATPEIWLVEWTDAVGQTGWEELDEDMSMVVYTVGIIVLENEERLCIASSWSDDILGDITHIPIGMVNARRRLNGQ